MLLLMLLVHHVLAGDTQDPASKGLQPFKEAKEIPKQTNYMMRHIDTCPPEGYFFKKEMGRQNQPGPCYLCFCQEKNRAICWPRENKRCDVEHYHHHGVGKRKRDLRTRRSPAGLSDIFFRDNLRELFGKNSPENCKPFESSYSIGCPPSDWCIGCTVCDCDANGRWNCHLLSFCPEKEKKKNMHRGPKGPYGKKRIYRRKNSIGDTSSMIKVTGSSSNRSKATKISPVKKQSKKIQLTPAKKNSQVVKTSSSPQIKQSVLTKRSPHIVKSPATKRSKEIKKGIAVQRSQPVSKNVVKKSSPVKRKNNTTTSKKIVKKDAFAKITQTQKVQVKKTLSSKKPIPVKRQLPVSEKKGTKKESDKKPVKRSSISGNKISETRTKRPVSRKLALTTRPVIVNSKVLHKKKTVSPAKKANSTTPIPMTSADLHQAIGQEVVKTFMSAFQRAMKKNAPKQRRKRNVANINLITDNNSYDDDGRLGKLDRDYDSILRRVKRTIENITVTSNVTEEYNATTSLYSESVTPTEPTTDTLDVFEVTTTTQNASWNTYYKYSVEDNMENTTEPVTTMYEHINVTDAPKNNSAKRSVKEKVIDAIKPQKYKVVSIKLINHNPSSEITKPILTTALTPPIKVTTKIQTFPSNEANDLKFNKWSEENLKIDEQNLLMVLNSNTTTPQSILNKTGNFKKLRNSKVTRKVGLKHKKYKLKKIINTLLNKTKKYEKINLTRTLYEHTNTSDFKHFVTRILHDFNKKHVTRSRNKTRKFKIIKYLQKVFKKMFHVDTHKNKTIKNNSTSKITKLNMESVLETLCESFGPCYIDYDVKSKLHSKIDDLNAETNRMLVTIKTIKGLLRLIDFAKNDKELHSTHVNHLKPTLKDDIHKLSAILKGTYVQKEKIYKLTQTQLTQMEYIKRNAYIFMESTRKFAKILNEIIDIIKRSNANMKNNVRRKSRSHENLDERHNDIKNIMSFEKVKDLLVKYNVLQNQFVDKMYQIVSKLEPPVTQKPITAKPLGYKDFDKENRTAAIQIYANNIIRNLRKLKYLAQNLSNNNRMKRELRDDDSMEYLLVLMEYLLKQNYPLDTAPVNDGIDLLIDTIKHAPDIKIIQKKVLVKDSLKPTSSNVTTNFKSTDNDVIISIEDNVSENNNNISREVNLTSQQDESKLNFIEESFDESDIDYKYLETRKSNKRISTATTAEPEYKNENVVTDAAVEEVAPDFPEVTESLQILGVTIPVTTMYKKSNERELTEDKTMDALSSEEKEKDSENININERTCSQDSKNIFTTTTDQIETRSDVPETTPVTKAEIVFDLEKIRHYDQDDVSISRSGDKKYLDWLDESFEEEYKNEANLTESLRKNALDVKKSQENSSNLSKDSFVVKKKGDQEDVMYNKEMNLLNSLDYGFPKSDSENSDTNESLEDKFENDAIPSYFA